MVDAVGCLGPARGCAERLGGGGLRSVVACTRDGANDKVSEVLRARVRVLAAAAAADWQRARTMTDDDDDEGYRVDVASTRRIDG